MPMGKYGGYAELLDTAARVAMRSYTHCPQTARVYYKPPATPTTARSNGTSGNGNGRSAGASSSCSSSGDGGKAGAAGAAEASSAAAARRKQQEAAAKVAFDAAEIMVYGGV